MQETSSLEILFSDESLILTNLSLFLLFSEYRLDPDDGGDHWASVNIPFKPINFGEYIIFEIHKCFPKLLTQLDIILILDFLNLLDHRVKIFSFLVVSLIKFL